jgi:hypothetical protein
MSEVNEEMPGPTKPQAEHAWLANLVGTWKVETTMSMGPGTPESTATGEETVTMMGGLWAVGDGKSTMPDGDDMFYKTGLGYDVSFKGYRGYWIASASSHLWKYEGELSEDGKVMTLNCEGPDMVNEGKTANYRDVIELIDENTRTMTSYGQDDKGEWHQFMKATYTRA